MPENEGNTVENTLKFLVGEVRTLAMKMAYLETTLLMQGLITKKMETQVTVENISELLHADMQNKVSRDLGGSLHGRGGG